MVMNVTASEMAVGKEDRNTYVVVVLANGGVEMVKGPLDCAEARKTTAQLMCEDFNALDVKVFMRPLCI